MNDSKTNKITTMVLCILFFAIIYAFSNCMIQSNTNQNAIFMIKNSMHNDEPSNKIEFDDEAISVVSFDVEKHWMIFKTGETYSLTKSDMQLIDSLLKNKVDAYNVIEKVKFEQRINNFPNLKLQLKNYTINLNEYKRQYLAVKMANGEINVYINCFCSVDHKNSKNELIYVLDGGKCYFHTTINITDRTCSDLLVNGES